MKFMVFFLGLALTVGAAVSVAAQDRPSTRTDPRMDLFFAQGGSQLGMRISDTENGVRVDEVEAGSPAYKAGIREGDVVVEFDGERVRSAMQLTRLVRETPSGREVAVAVMREGKRQALPATPQNREPGTGDREFRDPEFFLRQLPYFSFDYDDRYPRRFEFRAPAPGSRFPVFRGRLGVTVQSLTPDLEEYFGASNGGALVSSVARGSVGAKAGIKAGDVIIAINGRQVNDAGDATRELRDLEGEVTIVVLRDKQEMTLTAAF